MFSELPRPHLLAVQMCTMAPVVVVLVFTITLEATELGHYCLAVTNGSCRFLAWEAIGALLSKHALVQDNNDN